MPKDKPKKTSVKKAAMELMGGTKRDTPKYTKFRSEYKDGRGEGSVGKDPRQQYSQGSAPRTGGPAPKASGLKAATSKQMKAAKQMVRKGTGSGAKKRI
jgi:hypothetical protein